MLTVAARHMRLHIPPFASPVYSCRTVPTYHVYIMQNSVPNHA